MKAAAFDAEQHELCAGRPELGTVALLPWDGRIFGFPVGQFDCGPRAASAGREVSTALHCWAEDTKVKLCVCVVPFSAGDRIAFLPELGFRFVDFNVHVELPGLQFARLPAPRLSVRPAHPGDALAVAEMAERSFRFGRYHADARFPKALAHRRFRSWMENALVAAGPESRVYVIDGSDGIQGFYHVTIENEVADLRLAAVDLPLQRTLIGFDLYASTLHALKQAGVRRVISKISAANTSVMNVYSLLGFRFSSPEAVFHWHLPGLPGVDSGSGASTGQIHNAS